MTRDVRNEERRWTSLTNGVGPWRRYGAYQRFAKGKWGLLCWKHNPYVRPSK